MAETVKCYPRTTAYIAVVCTLVLVLQLVTIAT